MSTFVLILEVLVLWQHSFTFLSLDSRMMQICFVWHQLSASEPYLWEVYGKGLSLCFRDTDGSQISVSGLCWFFSFPTVRGSEGQWAPVSRQALRVVLFFSTTFDYFPLFFSSLQAFFHTHLVTFRARLAREVTPSSTSRVRYRIKKATRKWSDTAVCTKYCVEGLC